MSERDRTEGNTDAPKVGENEVGTDERGGSGPRRVEEARREREPDRGPHSGYASSPERVGSVLPSR